MEALYREASYVIEQTKLKKGNVKGLCFNSSHANKRKLYALVCQTLKYQKVLNQLLKEIIQDHADEKLDDNLQLVIAYDILFGKGIKCGGRIGQFVKKNKDKLFQLFEDFQEKNGTPEQPENNTISLPRYVRINTLKTTADEVIKELEDEGWQYVHEKHDNLDASEFSSDQHVPNLLLFSPGTDLHKHPLYMNGCILLQDKASCLPALLLKPKPLSSVIDACAAPGNKTTHLSAIMNNQGKVFAFDLDVKRLRLLKDQLRKAGTRNVEAMHQDFLKVNPGDERFKHVKYILLDPSCSGSGMVSRMDHLLESGPDDTERLNKRLEALSRFQYAMLCHALSFPSVKKVSYSTCSVHQQENEIVVERAHNRFCDEFSIVKCLPEWKHRGLESSEIGPYCLRASPDLDKTNGFFVAIFKRLKRSEDPRSKRKCDTINNIDEGQAKRKRKSHSTSLPTNKTPKHNLTKSVDAGQSTKIIKKAAKSRRKRSMKLPVTLK